MITTLFVSFFVLIILNVPIGVALGFCSTVALMQTGDTDLMLVVQRMFRSINSTTLLAVPLFIFAGKIMEKGGVSQRIVDFSYALVGWMQGSLAVVTVVACMFFAALSGSAPATVVAIGGIMAPMMIKDGYPITFSVTLPAAAGCIGVIIPPSIPFVNYSVLTGVSIGDIFVAGIVPGLLMGFVLIGLSLYLSHKYKWGRAPQKFDIKVFLQATKRSFLALLMPFIILGGIYSGKFTPTEAAAVACGYGVLLSCFIYRETRVRDLPVNAYEGGRTNGMVFLIIATSSIFSWILTTEQIPALISNFILGITDNAFLILLLINIILLINGCFMELTASTFIYVPIMFPLAEAIGIDPIHFGVMMVLNMTLGVLTPPLGINLFIATGLHPEAKFNAICKQVIPMFILLVIVLMVVTYVPEVSIGLVHLLGH